MNTEVGVVRDIRLKELRIYTDYGRCSRPLFIVEKQRLLIKKKDIQKLQQRVKQNFFVNGHLNYRLLKVEAVFNNLFGVYAFTGKP